MGILCGTDIIEISRVKKSIEKMGNAFAQRVYTDREISYCDNKKASMYKRFAARFAAKEAFSKAAGTGIGEAVGWKDIEVLNDDMGRPYVAIYGKVEKLLKRLNARNISISLSHCNEYATAFVVIETY